MNRFACCAAVRCREGKRCSVLLPDHGEPLCVSGTQLQSHHAELAGVPLCDCIVTWAEAGKAASASIELKSGGVDVSHAVDQLQAGANLLMAEASVGEIYAAVLATKGRFRTVEINELRKRKVVVNGRRHPVLLARCGDDLIGVLGVYSYL